MSQDRPTWHRRRFLKTTLTTAGGLSLLQGCASSPSPSPTSSPAPAPPDAQTTAAQGDARLDYARGAAIHHTSAVVQSACTLCNSLCALDVLTRHGRAYAVRAPSAQAPAQADEVQAGQLCVKADLLLEIAHSPKRLTQPLRRVSGQRGDPDARFKPISWPEALRHLARTLLALRDQGLAHTIANRTTGRMLRGSGALVDRFFTLLGSPNATDVGPVCNDAGGYALAMTFGLGQFTNGYGVDPITGQEDLGQAKLLLFLGTNQAETHPVTFAHLLRQRERTGAKLIVVDPRQTPTGALADAWIAPKPHTDLAIVLGMLGHIIEHKLHDAAFVSRWVLGFDELAAHLKAQGCSAAWADAQADLAPGTTAWLARSYATTKPAAIFCNAGISHQMSAFDTYRALTFLAAITGQIGVPGAGCNFMHNTWPGALALPPLPHSPPTITQPALPQGPDSFAAAILDASPYPLRVIISQGNPLQSSANTSRVRQAYSALDLFVYTGLFMEESALWADLILPVTSGLETEGVYMRRDDRGIRWQEAAIARVGQAKTDVELWIELAHAMADLDTTRGEAYWRDAFPRAWLDYKTLWDEFIARTPGAGGLTRARLQASRRPLRWPCPSPEHPGTSTLYLDHPRWYEAVAALAPERAGQRFLTPSGKIELTTPALVARLGVSGHHPLPSYYTHPEVTGQHRTITHERELVANPLHPRALTPRATFGATSTTALEADYPLMGMIGRPSVVHFAGVTHWTTTGKRLDGVRLIQLHPETAKRAKIQDGQTILVQSPRGQIHGTALLWEGIRQDTIFVPNTFGPAQVVGDELGQPRYEPANLLLDDRAFDPLSGQQAYKCFACRVRPA